MLNALTLVDPEVWESKRRQLNKGHPCNSCKQIRQLGQIILQTCVQASPKQYLWGKGRDTCGVGVGVGMGVMNMTSFYNSQGIKGSVSLKVCLKLQTIILTMLLIENFLIIDKHTYKITEFSPTKTLPAYFRSISCSFWDEKPTMSGSFQQCKQFIVIVIPYIKIVFYSSQKCSYTHFI